MLFFSSLKGNIAEMSKILTSEVGAGFHAILTCGPVQTSCQVDIDIYEDELGQSGDRILSSHITNVYITYLIISSATAFFNSKANME